MGRNKKFLHNFHGGENVVESSHLEKQGDWQIVITLLLGELFLRM
jgi:hypothetical protein